MAEIEYEDMLLINGDVIKMTIKGNDPFGKLYKNIEVIVRQTLEIDSPKWIPKKIGWDDLDGSFFGHWFCYKPGDRWTRMNLTIYAFGHQSLTNKDGDMTIKLKGTIRTKYEYSHNIQRSIWWAYNFLFYKHIRSRWYFEYQDLLYEIEDKIRALYGLRQKKNPELAKYV